MEIPVYEAEESPCRAYVIQRRTKETRISVDLLSLIHISEPTRH